MNRTDRLYALVEELRASATPAVTALSPARRFPPSAPTIDEELAALQQAGVPIYATPGRPAGFGIDAARTLPPVTFTAGEATAIAVALAGSASSPFAPAGEAVLRKVLAAMTEGDAAAARHLSERVRLHHADGGSTPMAAMPPARADAEAAIAARLVVRIDYEDKEGAPSCRAVEPLAAVEAESRWYLWAWCRLRDGARMFRMDRIKRLVLTEESAPERGQELEMLDVHRQLGLWCVPSGPISSDLGRAELSSARAG